MEPVEPDRPSSRRGRTLLIVLGVGTACALLALVAARLFRGVDRELADLTEEGVLALTDAIVDELFAVG